MCVYVCAPTRFRYPEIFQPQLLKGFGITCVVVVVVGTTDFVVITATSAGATSSVH